MKTIEHILQHLDVSEGAQKVYTSLLSEGDATARILAHRTGIVRTSIYDNIKELQKFDLVGEKNDDGVATFTISDVRRLQSLFDDSLDELSLHQEKLSQELPKILAAQKTAQPKIRFFSGSDGIKQLLKDILWYDDITLKSIWPFEQMHALLDDEFIAWFEKRRIRNGIEITVLWPQKQKKKGGIYDSFSEGVQKKYLPRQITPDMSYIIYDNKVAFISSQKEAFGFIVESEEFVTLQTMQFDLLWSASKK